MLPFFLYLSAGLITGFHLYSLLALAVYGVPINPLELVALSGSFCLLIAAYLSLFKPHVAGRIALIAALAIWSFYGPAIAKTIQTRHGRHDRVSSIMTGPTPGSVSAPENEPSVVRSTPQ
jgi:hypothetical protein